MKGNLPPNGGPVAEPTKSGLVMATPEGRVLCAPGATREWLRNYFGPRKGPRMLPARIIRWLARLKNNGEHVPLAARREDSRLTVALVHPEAEGGICLLLTVEPRRAAHAQKKRVKVTRREGEVLALLRAGHSNDAIARILGISNRTVGKHVEHLLDKLKVKNRTAAAALEADGAGSHG